MLCDPLALCAARVPSQEMAQAFHEEALPGARLSRLRQSDAHRPLPYVAAGFEKAKLLLQCMALDRTASARILHQQTAPGV